MSSNDNYPPGAELDSNAPYNQPLNRDFTRTISISLSFDYTTTLQSNCDEEYIRENINKEIERLIYKGQLYRSWRVENLEIDELEVINE